jgi:30S ribosomal protein S31
MGRGDKKTKKGKIFKGSFGKSRPAKKNNKIKKDEKKEE